MGRGEQVEGSRSMLCLSAHQEAKSHHVPRANYLLVDTISKRLILGSGLTVAITA
jgi:hypothetical protein